jgi:hypothetical protein
MRQTYEDGLDFDASKLPMTMWLSHGLMGKVRRIFHENYNLPFQVEELSFEDGFDGYEVSLHPSVDAHTFLRHLVTVPRGGYALLPG